MVLPQSGDRYHFTFSRCSPCAGCTVENLWKVPISFSAVLEHSTRPSGHLATLETLSIDPGYWRATNKSTKILKCYNEDACTGGLTGSSGYCLEGYTGPCEFSMSKSTDVLPFRKSQLNAICLIAYSIILSLFYILPSRSLFKKSRGVGFEIISGNSSRPYPSQFFEKQNDSRVRPLRILSVTHAININRKLLPRCRMFIAKTVRFAPATIPRGQGSRA